MLTFNISMLKICFYFPCIYWEYVNMLIFNLLLSSSFFIKYIFSLSLYMEGQFFRFQHLTPGLLTLVFLE